MDDRPQKYIFMLLKGLLYWEFDIDINYVTTFHKYTHIDIYTSTSNEHKEKIYDIANTIKKQLIFSYI